MRGLFFCIALLAGTATALNAEIVTCNASDVVVEAPDAAQADLVCEAVARAQSVLGQCQLPTIEGPLRVEIVEKLPPGCVALYHCQEKWIEILTPAAMKKQRERDGAFGFLDLSSYFRSVVVHELSHVIFDDVLCPFEACIAADEYVAYGLQVMSLSREQQKAFEDRAELNRKISRDELNAMFLFMAPNKYAQKAWTHVSQRDDPCAFIGQVIDGTILFDRDHF